MAHTLPLFLVATRSTWALAIGGSMATQQQMHRHGQHYDYGAFQQDSVSLPTRSNLGFALGMAASLVAIFALIIYYVL